jgi:HK97 family phage portal protein
MLDRLHMAFDVLRGMKVAYEMMPTWERSKPVYPAARFAQNVTSGYRKNELIYACVAIKADAAAQPLLRVHDRQSGDELPEHPLRRLIEQPNPYMTEFDFFAATMVYLDLAGRSYWEKVRSRAGRVVQLWPLRPDWVAPISSPQAFIAGYEYRVPGIETPITLPPGDVLDFRVFDPLNLYQGLAPVQVAARVGDVDNATTDMIKLFLEKGGMPPGLLTTKQKLVDAEVAGIRRRWRERYGGYEKWTEPAVLDSDATYQRTGLTFQEMGFDVLDARSEARICMVLRVPPILVGAKVGLDRSTFSNYAEARKALWQDTLMPQYRRLRDECQSDLATEFGDDLNLRWDVSGVPALQEDQSTLWERALKAFAAGGITRNEYRDMLGQETTPSGDVFVMTLSQVEVPLKRAKGELQQPKPVEDEPEQEPDEGDEKMHSIKASVAPDDRERRRHERQVAEAMEGYFAGQLKRIKRAVV